MSYNLSMTLNENPLVTPDDQAFVRAFESGHITNQPFHHRDHLRLAWVQIHRLGYSAATEWITRRIQQSAAHHRSADRYNDTMTRFWVRVIDLAIHLHPELSFDALLDAEPHLLDKTLPFRHWSRDQLMSPLARDQWLDPDVRPMPAA
jgi:hypothetical protein